MHYCPRCPREEAGRAVCMSPRLAASAQRTAVGSYWLPMRLACTMPRRRRADASSTVTPGPGRRRRDSDGVARTGQVDQSRTFVREAARRRRQDSPQPQGPLATFFRAPRPGPPGELVRPGSTTWSLEEISGPAQVPSALSLGARWFEPRARIEPGASLRGGPPAGPRGGP